MIVDSNDLKGCFDTITHIPMTLGFHRLGVPLAPINWMIDATQEMEHCMCTALGTSEAHCGNAPTESPPAGTLQGNGAGVAGWQVVCGPLASTMLRLGFGYREWTIVKRRLIQIFSTGFIDDTDSVHNARDPQMSTQDMIAETQDALKKWEGLVAATGGSLAPEKVLGVWWNCDEAMENGDKSQQQRNQETFGSTMITK